MTTLRRNLLLAIGSVIVMLCSLEAFARIILGVQPVTERFQLDPLLGWEWTPGYNTTEVYHGVEYPMVISQQSLRNPEIIVPKPANTFRIIALGDSITEGPGVNLDRTFAKQLEHLLQIQDFDRQIEVINAGTGDYGTEQELIWLRERGLNYQPDLLILGVYLNDSRSFDPPPATVAALNNFFLQHSAFYAFYRNMLRANMVEQSKAAPDFRFRYMEMDTWDSEAWRTNPQLLGQIINAANQDWGLAWNPQELDKIKSGIGQIASMVNLNNFKLLVVIFPVKVQIYSKIEPPQGLDYPQQELVAFANSQQIPVMDMLPVLRQHKDEDLFYDHAHFKPDAHQIVADALLERLLTHGLIDQSP